MSEGANGAYPHTAFIGIGSNLEQPKWQVQQAFLELDALPETQLSRRSSLYQSAPLGPGRQADYINAVAMLNTALTPMALLNALQAIERQQGREPSERWAPRVLDLDILLFDNLSIECDTLVVPHAEMTKRNFVLRPLLEIAPDTQLPDGSYLREQLDACPDNALHKLTQSTTEYAKT